VPWPLSAQQRRHNNLALDSTGNTPGDSFQPDRRFPPSPPLSQQAYQTPPWHSTSLLNPGQFPTARQNRQKSTSDTAFRGPHLGDSNSLDHEWRKIHRVVAHRKSWPDQTRSGPPRHAPSSRNIPAHRSDWVGLRQCIRKPHALRRSTARKPPPSTRSNRHQESPPPFSPPEVVANRLSVYCFSQSRKPLTLSRKGLW